MLFLQLLSKGRLIKQGVIPAGSLPFGLSSDSSISTAQFKVYFDSKLAQEASPSARMLVWFMTVSNEMIVDTVDFSVKGAIANQVSARKFLCIAFLVHLSGCEFQRIPCFHKSQI